MHFRAERQIWHNMRYRCENPECSSYRNYGGRGISIDPSWKSFDKFIADMGPRPSPKHSIDRIDNDGNYESANCRWATRTEQSKNQRSRRKMTNEEAIAKYLRKIGRKGGKRTSPTKAAAVRANLERARAKRWPVKNKKKNSAQ